MDGDYPRRYALTSYQFDGNAEDYLVGRLVFKYMNGRRVLNLGCGPTEGIFGVFYPEAKEVVAVDLLRSNLDFSENKSHLIKPIIARARAYRLRYLSAMENNPKTRYVMGDIRKRLGLGRFDSVMQIGAFGTLRSAKEFETAVRNSYHYLKRGGRLLMVNWVGRKGEIDCSRMYKPSLEKAGFRILEMHSTSIGFNRYSKKEGYKKLIWAVAEK